MFEGVFSSPSLPPCLVFLGVQPEMQTLVERRIYPFLLMVVTLLAILSFQIRQFKRLYEHIKNDKSVQDSKLPYELCFLCTVSRFPSVHSKILKNKTETQATLTASSLFGNFRSSICIFCALFLSY